MGWSGVKNGQLLRLAALEFEAFITVDKNFQYQQDLLSLPIAAIVLLHDPMAHMQFFAPIPLMPHLLLYARRRKHIRAKR